MEDGQGTSSNDSSAETSSPEEKSSNLTWKGSSHRRSFSGSLSAFLFQRTSSQGQVGQVPSSNHANKGSIPTTPTEEDASQRPRSAMAMAIQQKGIRRRKGSLRKTALLGTGKLRAEGKERLGSQLEQMSSAMQNDSSFAEGIALMNPPSPYDMPTPRPISSVPPPVPIGTHPVHGDPSKILAQEKENQTFPSLQRPRTADSTASTTDEEESPISPSAIAIPPLPKTKPDSYFPLQLQRPTRHTTVSSRSSPLASLPPTVPSPPPSEWDYSETRWWGWIILAVTWIFFVVGMGSCFDVWSWAWDVGETPYAPPELEDDPTLPVVSYYPALIILTSVMAWVWVTIAWVGMKYFKHANIPGDE